MEDHVFYRSLKRHLTMVDHGEGIYLIDKQGKRYIDGCSGSVVANIGHGNAKVVQAIKDQAEKVAFTHLSRWTSEPIIKLAAMVAKLAPGTLNKLYLVSGGSEATETALKMARQYYLERDGSTGKYKIISRWKSYHGNTIGALSMTGDKRRRKYTPLLLDFPHIAPCYCYRCPFGLQADSCKLACAYDLEREIKAQGAENIAAFIAEPIVGAASGALVPPEGYFKVIREICTHYDILFIADEVMTGFGRTGSMFAIDQFGVVPDLMCIAKGMSAGYSPLGGVIAKEEIYKVFKEGSGGFVHGHTYGGNPLSAAVSVAVLGVLESEGLADNAKAVGEYLLHKMRNELSGFSFVGDIRGKGLMLGVEIVADKETKKPFSTKLGVAEKLTVLLMEKGLVVYPGSGAADGESGDHFLLAPPLIVNKAQADDIVEILKIGFEQFESVVQNSCKN